MTNPVTKRVKVFSWAQVPPDVTRKLLTAAYEAEGDRVAVGQVNTLKNARLARQAERVFGRSGIAKRHWETATPVLRHRWLPTLPAADVKEFAAFVQLELSGAARQQPITTKAQALTFITKRKVTVTFETNLMKRFQLLNKVERRVEAPRPRPMPPSVPAGVTRLEGKSSPDRQKPYPHQLDAWAAMDRLAAQPGRRAGLVILPTGAGKTYTMALWLLRQLARGADGDLRVLWIADQQELVEQAGRVFEELGATLPTGTSKQLRVLHGGAGTAAHLGSETLDIACVTRQTLAGAQFNHGAQKLLAKYLQRPTIVVIDEAHHAVAPQYRKLLDFAEAHTSHAMFFGLTATPWPAGTGMVKLLRERFDTTVAQVQVRDLVKSGVLATPMIHTVDTDVFVPLTPTQVNKIAQQDVPGDVLKKLDQEPRTQIIVRTWVGRRDEWGKTLVFAPTIENADRLGESFRQEGVQTWVVHSRAETPRRESISAFRRYKGGSAVLVSVGMLREGVDLPDARTAFLARPTTSRILMRQMIGRVLRGPSAGGDPYANIVDMRDRWGPDVDVLAPAELPDLTTGTKYSTSTEYRLPPILDEVTHEPIHEDILRRIQVAYDELWKASLPHASALLSTHLAGFYDLGDVNVPVFEHCLDAWEQVIQRALGHVSGKGAHIGVFDDSPGPRPVLRDVNAVIEFCKAHQSEPPLVEVRATFSIRVVAQELMDQPAMTEAEKNVWLHDKWASTLARTA